MAPTGGGAPYISLRAKEAVEGGTGTGAATKGGILLIVVNGSVI